MNEILDVGSLSIIVGKDFKIESNTLTVPFGSTLDQVAEFLSVELDKQEKAKQ